MSHWVGVEAFFRFEAGNKGLLGKVDLSFELRRATLSWIPGEVCHEAEKFPGWCHLPEGQCVRNLNSDTTSSRIRPAIHWLVWWWKKSVQAMCFKNYKAMSKALSSSLGTHRARSEEKEGRCGVKKRKMLLIAPPFPTLQKSWLLWAWRYWVWRKEYWVEERNGIYAPLQLLLRSLGIWMSVIWEEGVYLSKDLFLLRHGYLGIPWILIYNSIYYSSYIVIFKSFCPPWVIYSPLSL